MCATSDPTHGSLCPVSRAKYKRDIQYLNASERVQLIHDNVKTFDELLRACSPTHPNITLISPKNASPTVAQLRTNYDEVANCAYQQYGAKPYWIPSR